MKYEQRKSYYKTTNYIALPSTPQWRLWKFLLPGGRWKIFKGIKNLAQLRDYLVKWNPLAFYYSTSSFLNQEIPDKIEHPSWQNADQLFLFNQKFVIDIDNMLGSEQVKQTAYEVRKRMDNFQHLYQFDKTIFTGRGIRLEYVDLTYKPNLLPNEKEEWIKRTRKQFCLLNLADIPNVDHVIAWDTRRIIKCLGSPNPHNEFTTKVIYGPSHIPAIPGKLVNEMRGESSLSSLHELGRPPDQELGYSPSYPMYFGKFIRNKVEGTKDRFVPYFEYYKKYKHWLEDLKLLQEKFGLSTIYVVDDYSKVLCVSVDAIPAPRMDKMYRQSKAVVKNLWKKFRNLYIRTSSYYNSDLKKIKDYDLKPLFKLDTSPTKIHPLSKPHIDFVNHLGFDTSDLITLDRRIIGKEKNTVYETYFKNRRLDKVKKDGE